MLPNKDHNTDQGLPLLILGFGPTSKKDLQDKAQNILRCILDEAAWNYFSQELQGKINQLEE